MAAASPSVPVGEGGTEDFRWHPTIVATTATVNPARTVSGKAFKTGRAPLPRCNEADCL